MQLELICQKEGCGKTHKNGELKGRCSCGGSTFTFREIPEEPEMIRVTVDFLTTPDQQKIFEEFMAAISKLPKHRILKTYCSLDIPAQEEKKAEMPALPQQEEQTPQSTWS